MSLEQQISGCFDAPPGLLSHWQRGIHLSEGFLLELPFWQSVAEHTRGSTDKYHDGGEFYCFSYRLEFKYSEWKGYFQIITRVMASPEKNLQQRRSNSIRGPDALQRLPKLDLVGANVYA